MCVSVHVYVFVCTRVCVSVEHKQPNIIAAEGDNGVVWCPSYSKRIAVDSVFFSALLFWCLHFSELIKHWPGGGGGCHCEHCCMSLQLSATGSYVSGITVLAILIISPIIIFLNFKIILKHRNSTGDSANYFWTREALMIARCDISNQKCILTNNTAWCRSVMTVWLYETAICYVFIGFIWICCPLFGCENGWYRYTVYIFFVCHSDPWDVSGSKSKFFPQCPSKSR